MLGRNFERLFLVIRFERHHTVMLIYYTLLRVELNLLAYRARATLINAG